MRSFFSKENDENVIRKRFSVRCAAKKRKTAVPFSDWLFYMITLHNSFGPVEHFRVISGKMVTVGDVIEHIRTHATRQISRIVFNGTELHLDRTEERLLDCCEVVRFWTQEEWLKKMQPHYGSGLFKELQAQLKDNERVGTYTNDVVYSLRCAFAKCFTDDAVNNIEVYE